MHCAIHSPRFLRARILVDCRFGKLGAHIVNKNSYRASNGGVQKHEKHKMHAMHEVLPPIPVTVFYYGANTVMRQFRTTTQRIQILPYPEPEAIHS